MIAAPVTNPATPPCANALLAPAKVSIVACAFASALFSPAKSHNAPASELNASNSASLRSLAKSISS